MKWLSAIKKIASQVSQHAPIVLVALLFWVLAGCPDPDDESLEWSSDDLV